MKDFIKELLNKIRTFENSLKSLKISDIKIFDSKIKKDHIEEAEVVDINS